MKGRICRNHTRIVLCWLTSAVFFICGTALWAQDPGPRPVGTRAITFGGTLGRLQGPGHGNPSIPFLNTAIPDVAQPADGRGDEGAGRVLGGIGGDNVQFWWSGLAFFGQLASVDGATDQATNNPTITGLGPGFNGNSCFMCHSFPTIGGTAVGPTNENPNTVNPQVTLAHDKDRHDLFHPLNPQSLTFITAQGPIREARFITKPDGTLDGGVHDLFSIEGRTDAPANCQLDQPDFNNQVPGDNVIFRIPTPTFGLGVVEAISDANLQQSFDGTQNDRAARGIGGHFNHSGNDGSITRFGWKAQNKSLLLFAGEAANVELGVTNELFTNERTPGTGCVTNLSFEDRTHVNGIFPNVLLNQGSTDPDIAGEVSSLIENFAIFMRFNGTPGLCAFNSPVDTNPNSPTFNQARCLSLDNQVIPPSPAGAPANTNPDATALASISNGARQFSVVGCDLCHTQQLTSDPSNQAGVGNRTITPFSDFALHHMGAKLADGVSQGEAGPDEFRTAPLWGIGQRVFLLHDGRTTDLMQAILAHADDDLPAGTQTCFDTAASQNFNIQFPTTTGDNISFAPSSSTHSCASEANGVIDSFNALSPGDQTDIMKFLRSL